MRVRGFTNGRHRATSISDDPARRDRLSSASLCSNFEVRPVHVDVMTLPADARHRVLVPPSSPRGSTRTSAGTWATSLRRYPTLPIDNAS